MSLASARSAEARLILPRMTLSAIRPHSNGPPIVPVLVAGLRRALWVSADGELSEVHHAVAADRARWEAPLLCHAAATARRLGTEPFPALDILELFAFVRPARFCVPTPRGLAAALGLPAPGDPGAEAEVLLAGMRALLDEAAGLSGRRFAAAIAWTMARAGWAWSAPLLVVLGHPQGEPTIARTLAVWDRLPVWTEQAPGGPPANHPIPAGDARRRLAELLGDPDEGWAPEPRPQQADYASAVSAAFQPRARPDEPHLVLAEAGTGVGKTLGYVAPASLWAERNGAPVWISTFTRNLQHQLDGELDRLFPDPDEKRRKVVIRKGRENYLCLLNFEEAVRGTALRPSDIVALGLIARWAAATRDGDMVGGDFPAWLADLLGANRTRSLTDQRGECIYAACPHYRKCFVERSLRRARQAEIVVANHALVMTQAALGGEEGHLPTRYVFDEGHHVFSAADSAFSALLSGVEAAGLRRWVLGAEGGRSRARGLKRRIEELAGDSAEAQQSLELVLRAARALPGEGWLSRLRDGQPHGPVEAFLAIVRHQVQARASAPAGVYGLEAETTPPVDDLIAAAQDAADALDRLLQPVLTLRRQLAGRLDDEADTLETESRVRIEGACRSLLRRGELPLRAWLGMLAALAAGPDGRFVDWFALDRIDGRELDVGMHRHWVDPTEPFAAALRASAHGLLVTSATLTDSTGDAAADWTAAEARVGARFLSPLPIRAAVPSPFDYAAQTRVFVVNDVRKDDLAQVSAAYRALFLAAGGGGLGLFTAVSRLRAVHGALAGPLEEAGLHLYAQHVDRLDVSTLIEIFRAEPDSCLLGTDAVRDGVDVPGRALRLIVFDRVPWPRPDILHRARRAASGGRIHDDRIARLRLRQAFGRLVRRADDTGVFVLLDPMLPSRLAAAFPDGVAVVRTGLAEAVAQTRAFLESPARSSTDMTELTGIEALVFDLYGTVVDMQTGLTGAIGPFLKERGFGREPSALVTWWRRTHFENSMIDALIPGGHTPYREIGRRALSYTLERAGIPFTRPEVEGFVAEIQHLKPFPDVIAALERLHARYKLAILSNGDPDMLDAARPHIGFTFDAMISAGEAGHFKPHHATYRLAAGRLGLAPEQILFVANHAFDCIGAKACGMRTAFVDRRRRPFGETPHAPDVIVRNFAELAGLLS